MARLQVMQRQADPAAAQLAGLSGDIDRRAAVRQQLQLQKMVAATNAKNAETDVEKIKGKRVEQAFDALLELSKQNVELTPQVVQSVLTNSSIGEEATAEALRQLGEGLRTRQATGKERMQEATAGVMERALEGDGLGQLPPGAQLGPGGLTLPLNRPLTPEAARITGAADIVNKSVNELTTAIRGGQLQDFISQVQIDVGNPLLTGDVKDKLVSSMNALKGIVPFAKGGKQLTPFESKLLFRLLNTTGKSKETMLRDLERFQEEFTRINAAVTGGTQALANEGRAGLIGGTGRGPAAAAPIQQRQVGRFIVEEE